MKPKVLIWFLLLTVSLVSCAVHHRVLFDYDRNEDFSRYGTFGFYTLPEEITAEESSQYVPGLKAAVIRELQAKGLTLKEDAEGADLLIAIHTEPRSNFNITLWGYHYAPYDYYWRSDAYWQGGGIDEHAYPRGTLILDFVRADEEELIWRGVHHDALPHGKTGSKISKTLERAVAEILKTFPPRER